jgi:flavin reductase (DIM6/NTAB) family NADH-FMN oxidoreductase RutF
MTWAAAVTPDRVRFGVDHGTATLANLRRTGRATLQVIARDAVLVLVKGAAREVRDRIVAAPFGMALWELAVSAVKDQSWGGVVVAPLTFVWTGPDADRMRLVEQHVLAELREGPP